MVVQQNVTWAEALAGAASYGGYLASITSSAENNFVFDLIKDDANLWWTDDYLAGNTHGVRIGGYDPGKDNHWAWSTGEAWSYDNFHVGEPNHIGREDTVAYFAAQSRVPAPTWNNVENAWTMTPGYVVEFNTPEPGTLLLLAPALGLIALRRRRRA